jgi:hypothetical protein
LRRCKVAGRLDTERDTREQAMGELKTALVDAVAAGKADVEAQVGPRCKSCPSES